MKVYNLVVISKKMTWGTFQFHSLGSSALTGNKEKIVISNNIKVDNKLIIDHVNISRTRKNELKLVKSEAKDNWIAFLDDTEYISVPKEMQNNISVIDNYIPYNQHNNNTNKLVLIHDGTLVKKVYDKSENKYTFLYFGKDKAFGIIPDHLDMFINKIPYLIASNDQDTLTTIVDDNDKIIDFYEEIIL